MTTDDKHPQDEQTADAPQTESTSSSEASNEQSAAASGEETPAAPLSETFVCSTTDTDSSVPVSEDTPVQPSTEASAAAPASSDSDNSTPATDTPVSNSQQDDTQAAPPVGSPSASDQAFPASSPTTATEPSAKITETPQPSVSEPTPEPNEPAPAPPAEVSDTTPQTDPIQEQPATSGEVPAAEASESAQRIREKLGQQTDNRARGSEDVKSLRPDMPTADAPVDIPEADDLDSSLEAEIASAMNGGSADQSASEATAPSSPTESPAATSGEEEEIGPGSKVKGVVQQIHGDDVFVEAGLRGSLIVSLKQFAEDKQPSVGDALEVTIDSVEDDGLYRGHIPRARHKAGGDWNALAAGQVVDCQVTGTNKGGLQVTVSNLRGFLPASQVDIGYVAELESYVGQKISVQVIEVNPKKRNLVVSRRVLLEADRQGAQEDFWKSLEVGQEYSGTVKTVKNYGAFVNMGPVDGFLHIGEMSWSRINHPNEVVKEGQEVQVKVLKIDPEKQRISLGMKQLIQNPWQSASEKYASERIVEGRVSRIADFGAFVELEPGVEGLVHISELAWRRVGSVKEVLSEGDVREFKVIEVDPKRKRVSLSLKALEERPKSAADEKPESAAPAAARRKPNPDLRGGTGGSGNGGGLFGNPSDFK